MTAIAGVCANCFFYKVIPRNDRGQVTNVGVCTFGAPTQGPGQTVIDFPSQQTCGNGADATTLISYSSGITGIPSAPPLATKYLNTGDFTWRPTTEMIEGRVRANGLTIGDGSSGATELADPLASNLFYYLWNNFTNTQCPVSGGRGASATVDFAAHKTITTPDMRFRGPFGLDGMGNSAAGRSTGATFATGNATTAGSVGGEGGHTLADGEMPSHSHVLPFGPGDGSEVSPQGMVEPGLGSAYPRESTDATGSGDPHNNMPPFMLGTWYIFL